MTKLLYDTWSVLVIQILCSDTIVQLKLCYILIVSAVHATQPERSPDEDLWYG